MSTKEEKVLDKGLKQNFIRSMLRIKQALPAISGFMDINVNEMLILANILGSPDDMDDSGCTYVSDIMGNVFITKSAVSQTLSVLEKNGLITRETDLADRRRVAVSLTQKGKAAVQKAQEEMEGFLQVNFERFGEENIRKMTEYITGFADVLQEVNREMQESKKSGK